MSPLSLLSLLFLAFDLPPGDWIVTRGARVPWEELLSGDRLAVLRTFGPEGQYGWVRGKSSWRVKGSVIAVQPNFRYSVTGDPDLDKSWGLQNTGQTLPSGLTGKVGSDVGVLDAWNQYPWNHPVTIAILDSGIDANHEELRNRVWRNTGEISGNGVDDDGNGFADDSVGWNFVGNAASITDDNGHGTFCAGIVGAEPENSQGTRGIHPEARLMAVKMLDSSGFGTTASAISAIHYAVENGAKLINASWGGGNYDQALYDTVKWAGDRGVLFIAAAGNDGKHNDTDLRPTYPASFGLPNVISVAAYNARDEIATFSNYGKEKVHVGAPGVEIYGVKLGGGYRYGEGTSFAAPFVSAVAGLVWSAEPSLAIGDWKRRLLMTSVPLHYYEKERTQSGGRIHAGNALRDFRPERPVVPVQWMQHVASGATAHPYENKAQQEIRFRHPGASHVRAHFKAFETEACCDRVTLKDGSGRFIAEYRGSLGDFWSADALGDEIVVQFTSDYSISKYGFEIDASASSR